MVQEIKSEEEVGTPTMVASAPRQRIWVEIWNDQGRSLFEESCDNGDDDGSFRARVGEALTKALRGEG